MSSKPTVLEADINKALMIFLTILEQEKSYVIQHEPTYYFVFQWIPSENRYLVMNNTIGERNEAIYRDSFRAALREMLILLQTFYNNIPMISIKEHK
jgi:bifunctional pyridoxal-dependent enzyme with beta-cystathionase and maltose regulon repressor activities